MKIPALAIVLLGSAAALVAATPPATLPFVDEFDAAPHDWVTDTPTWIGKIKDGRFICENLNPNAGRLNWAARELPLEKGRDFEILTRVKMIEGAPNGFAMIVWDGGTDLRRYFEISTTGKYGTYHEEKGVWGTHHVGISSLLIRKTEDNDLAIRGIGGRAFFFINGTAVDAMDHAGLTGRWVGLVTVAGGTNSFDRLEVRYLDGSPEKRVADARTYETEARAALVAGGPPLQEFAEKFDGGNRSWAEDATMTAKIVDGVLEWQNRASAGEHYSWFHWPINDAASYEVSMRVRHFADKPGNNTGLQWGATTDGQQMMQLTVSGDGHWTFGQRMANQYSDVVPWRKTSLLKPGQFNEVRVRQLGATLFLFINGQPVADLPSRPLRGDRVTLVTAHGITAAYDDVKLGYAPLTQPQIEEETARVVAQLKRAHEQKELGAVYSVARKEEIRTAQSRKDQQDLEDQRWKLTDADFKQLTKVRNQFSHKKLLSLYASWGRPASISEVNLAGFRVYYNYKLVGRTQYYYEFPVSKLGSSEKDWVIGDVQHTDRRY